MRRSKFTESQIVGILGEGEVGLPVAEICRKHGISNATYYQWKSKYSGVSAICAPAVLKSSGTVLCFFQQTMENRFLSNADVRTNGIP